MDEVGSVTSPHRISHPGPIRECFALIQKRGKPPMFTMQENSCSVQVLEASGDHWTSGVTISVTSSFQQRQPGMSQT